MPTQDQVDHYNSQGYMIVDDLADGEMLQRLLRASERAKAKVRAGEVDVYTHWATKDNKEPWAIRGILAPEFDETVFAEHMLSDSIMKYVHYFLGTELRLGSILIFTNPYHKDWGLGWHRDLGKQERDGSYDQEMTILNKPQFGMRWQLALVDDACLMLVPGSHRRYRTDHERECLINDGHADIPGQMAIDLKAGQAAIWNGNTIHRSVIKKDVERLTIAGSWSQNRDSDEPEETDVRFTWRLKDSVRAHLPQKMHIHYDRWRALQLG
jgi:ectoine hydroxylase-related dioxygenase (phytanoyl-CoA dioxygenase family)